MHRAKTWGTVGSWVSQSEEQYEHAWGFQTWCDVTWNDNQWVGALIPLGNQTASPHKTRRAQCLHSPCGHDPSWNHRWDSSLALQGLAPCIGRPPNLSLSLSHTHMYIYIYIQAYTSSKYLIVYVVVFFLNTPHLWQIWRCSTIFSLLSHYWNDWSAWVQSLVVWLFGPSMCSEKYERSMEKKDQEWFTMT